MKSVFIFRRDLRLEDNTALLAALKSIGELQPLNKNKLSGSIQNSERTGSEETTNIVPCFIFDPRQIESSNKYRSKNAMQFMAQSLKELQSEIKSYEGELYFFLGAAEEVISEILNSNKEVTKVYFNKDYTPFSRKRDREITSLCKQKGVVCESFHDALLSAPGEITNSNDEPYKVFTPFMHKVRERHTPKPASFKETFEEALKKKQKEIQKNTRQDSSAENTTTLFGKLNKQTKHQIDEVPKEISELNNKNLFCKGGRKEGIELLNNISELNEYNKERDFPALHKTSRLSAHLKFGTISVREAWHAVVENLGYHSQLLTEFIWRDFYAHITFSFPEVFGNEFQEKYRGMSWENNPEYLTRWKEGKTGFPIVDAGMRQLNKTGWMHNRVRMIVASFLTKDLHIDWREGERYFAQQLVDYDPASNNGGWQWAASTGTDAQPYFRIFNPWSQQERFDPEAEYIKEFIPELRELSPKVIHSLYKNRPLGIEDYPAPIVDHAVERKKALERYKAVK